MTPHEKLELQQTEIDALREQIQANTQRIAELEAENSRLKMRLGRGEAEKKKK